MKTPPIPENEMERIINLSDFNIDYSNFENNFKDLAKLAAKVAGTHISLVNLIDSYTQWTVSQHGLEIEQMPREDSVCQYTIVTPDHFEVTDLTKDERFKDKFYVTGDPFLRYYYGVPLRSDGHNIGALCVLDRDEKSLTPEKVELLKIIAEEIVNRLKTLKYIESLRNTVSETKHTQNKVVHDIRGPIGGIMGLAQIIAEQGKENDLDEVLEFINLIYKSGKTILELADEILSADKKRNTSLKSHEMTLVTFKEKLEKLYMPQARSKNILFVVTTNRENEEIAFPQNKLLQIAGNLISNAIKFTPKFGDVVVNLDLSIADDTRQLKITIKDTGVGLDQAGIDAILSSSATSTTGTGGETGYGFGLELVKHLIKGMNGTFNITSEPGAGATFEVVLPI